MSSSTKEDKSMKTHAKSGLRLPFAAIVALAGVVIILIAGMILVPEEITNLTGTVSGIQVLLFFSQPLLVFAN